MLLVCLTYFYHDFEDQALWKVNDSEWGNLASACYWQYISYIFFFFFPLVMFLPFPSSSRRSPACPRKMRIWSFPFSMFCVHLPRLLLNCMMKHSPTSTKVSISALRNLFLAGKTLTAAENKNHWQVIHFFLSCWSFQPCLNSKVRSWYLLFGWKQLFPWIITQ